MYHTVLAVMAPVTSYRSPSLNSHYQSLNARSDALPPLQVNSYLASRDLSTRNTNPNFDPGAGTLDPHRINNRGFFALFALLGVAMVLGGIWFFFWAKNGGFVFRKGDWEEYKSTVLRRKGPNGTTLSGATKTTRLGGGSVVAEGGKDMDEKFFKKGVQSGAGRKGRGPRGNKNNDDNDVRAYRHEKPAKVGGLNRESDGIFNQDFAYSDNTFSDDVPQASHIPINTLKTKNESKRAKPTTPSPKKKNNFYDQTPNSNASTDSHRPLRPNAHPPSTDSTPTQSRHNSPTKHHSRSSVLGSLYTEPLDFESRYSGSKSDAGLTEDSRGTKAYFHPIPGLGSEARGGGVGGVGGGGFRRGRGRRDSLSDSEGETVRS